jgi:hypothetical protein
MGVPYESKPDIITVTGETVHEVAWPHRSVISKILVTQLEGVGENFTVALFNHSQVDTGEQVSDSVGDTVGKLPNDMFRVSPDLVASAGKLLYFSDQATGGYGFVFFSQEDKAGGRQGDRNPKLYLRITPLTPTPRRFAVCVGGMKEIE